MKNLILILLLLSSCNIIQNNEPDKDQETPFPVEQNIEIDSAITQQSSVIIFDSTKCGLNFIKGTNYKNSINEIAQLKTILKKDFSIINDSLEKEIFLDSIMVLFSSRLLNEIIPYWYGTKWDFNGYTANPNDGVIACGYFVSTTLRDMGLNLDRYKLAQQGPQNEAKTVSILADNMLVLETADSDNISELFKDISEGLYFIGLDFHVGYFYKTENESYFIHSNYIKGKVMIELIEKSEAFESNKYFLSKISSNREIALKWIQGEEINVFK